MNERINELAMQAGEYANSVYKPPVRSKAPGKIWEDGHVGWHTLFNNKFAELIVRECAEFAEQKYGNWYRTNAPSDSPSIAIKQHFGVTP